MKLEVDLGQLIGIAEPRKKGLRLLILPPVQPFLRFVYLKIIQTKTISSNNTLMYNAAIGVN